MKSKVGRFRKIYPRIWRHTGFTGLTEGERLVALYALSGPQMNRIGLTHFSIPTAAEDLGTSPDTLAKRLGNVCATFKWAYDKKARVLYIPSWFTFNPPENPKVLHGILNDLGDVPASRLVDEFAQNLTTLDPESRDVRQTCPYTSGGTSAKSGARTGTRTRERERTARFARGWPGKRA